jgi:P27 family predicted phage terminase small subunit
MRRGPKPKPTALRRLQGNPGKRGYNHEEPQPPEGMPDCPDHVSGTAREEWDRLAGVLHAMGVVTLVDRAALAAYCQCYGRWVEAEEKLQATPMLLKTATGYVQQSPWLSIANKQLELMGRYMAELGLTPAARSRVAAYANAAIETDRVTKIEFVTVYEDEQGQRHERPLSDPRPVQALDHSTCEEGSVRRIYLDGNY